LPGENLNILVESLWNTWGKSSRKISIVNLREIKAFRMLGQEALILDFGESCGESL
jgi:hypothetical protein